MNTNKFIYDYFQRKGSMFRDELIIYEQTLSKQIKSKNILVIGGAGTIGSSFIKATLKFKPKKLVVLDINENGLTELVRDLRSSKNLYVPEEFYTYPLSYDSEIFTKLLKSNTPFDIVANFAAHKHVRSEKDIFSIEALLQNNLIKAKGLLDLLVAFPPTHFFCVSTDKAANPVNIMGASKKMMEELILSYSKDFKISTARFANVAFSNGSLLDGFLERINKFQPLACPSDVKRFFISPEESGEICLLACILGKSAEIFFPKLDPQKDLIRFADICPILLNEFGYKPFICESEEHAKNSMDLISEKLYPVYFFNSNTSGEKLYEEFYTENEQYDLNRYNSLGVILKNPSFTKFEIETILEELKSLFDKNSVNKLQIINILNKYIPEFKHIETGIGLDQKM